MAASTQKTYSTFVKGIITEAGPLTFPENASIDESNCVLNRDGSRQRRLGMDFESGFSLNTVTLTPTTAVSSALWRGVANDPTRNYVIVQCGATLKIFDASPTSTSSNLLATLAVPGSGIDSQQLSYAAGNGYMFLAADGVDPLYLEYNVSTGAFALNGIDVRVRDVFGVNDGLSVESQPTTLSTEHSYNLRNQGWAPDKISAYFASTGSYPSNAQQWFLGRKDDNTFDPQQLAAQYFGSTPAPKGRFLINLFERKLYRDNASGLSTPTDRDASRPSCVAFAFQRVWYAGMMSPTPRPTTTSPNLTGYVCYSRTVRGSSDFGSCFAEADPTSEVDSELVDTDGGFISIPDSGKIHRLVPVGDGVVVLAEHGVWEINGAGNAFTATNQGVARLSAFGAVGPAAVVPAEGEVFFWSKGGIYLVSTNSQGSRTVTNITENTIQTLINDIALVAKRNAIGAYDNVNKKVAWLYNDNDAYTGTTFLNNYSKELVLDLSLEAWYKHSISSHEDPSPYVAGYVEMPDALLRQEGVRTRGDSVLKYVAVQFVDPGTNTASITFSYYRDQSLRDWKSLDGAGVSFLSYCVTGYELMGDVARAKQAPYIIVHCKRTELNAITNTAGEVVPDNPSGLYMQAQWGWANSPTSGKWGNPQQVYRLPRPYGLISGTEIDYGESVITTKNRVRGSGKALSLYFYSDGDKDFYLHGWSTYFTGKQNV